MKKLLLLAFAAVSLAGCGALFSNSAGNHDRVPQRMVCMVLRFETDAPDEKERNILITTNVGQFNSIINQRDPDALDNATSQLIVTGRVFAINPGSVRLDINVKMSGASRNIGFEQAVSPVPGQKLLLHHEGLQSFFLTAYVIPGADDPERENILKLSPANAVQTILAQLKQGREPLVLPGTSPTTVKPKEDTGSPEAPKKMPENEPEPKKESSPDDKPDDPDSKPKAD